MMPCTDAGVRPAVVSAAAGRMRVHAAGLRNNAARADVIEETVARVTGVRAVRAYPRTASVVVWYQPADCDTAEVLSAIAGIEDVPATSAGTRISPSPVSPDRSGALSKMVGGLLQKLLDPPRDVSEPPPEIERLRTALGHTGFHLEPATARQPALDTRLQCARIHARSRWLWVALPLALAALRLTGVGVHSLTRWTANIGPRAGQSRPVRFRRPASPLAAVAASALAIPSWGGVVVSLLLVTVAGAIAYRQRLGVTRELVVAAARAAVQLVTAGALLRILFQRSGLLGAAGWIVAMIMIAGQVAGRRGAGLPAARAAATSGVGASTAVTLATLLAGRVIAAETRVIVPVGGMIVSSAMLAAGGALRRLNDEVRQSQTAIEARLSVGQTGREAISPHRRAALRTALIPAIDSTKIVGLISLPGAMTGLILAGISPLTAIRYQIVVMYMQLAGNALAALIAVRVAEEALFDDAQRLVQVDRPDEPS